MSLVVFASVDRCLNFEWHMVVLAGNLEDLMPPPEKYIFNFNSKEELKKWHLYSDSEFGGILTYITLL